jgi:hypothetical protein
MHAWHGMACMAVSPHNQLGCGWQGPCFVTCILFSRLSLLYYGCAIGAFEKKKLDGTQTVIERHLQKKFLLFAKYLKIFQFFSNMQSKSVKSVNMTKNIVGFKKCRTLIKLILNSFFDLGSNKCKTSYRQKTLLYIILLYCPTTRSWRSFTWHRTDHHVPVSVPATAAGDSADVAWEAR